MSQNSDTRSIQRRTMLTLGLTVTTAPLIFSSNRALAEPSSSSLMRRAYFNSPNGQIHYWTAGSGPDLFLVHQSNKDNEEYKGLIPYLSDHFRMIALDLPGHGQSDDPAGPHDVENLTQAAIDLADHLALERFHALGHHGGALVAMNMAAKLPDRIHKTIISGSSGPKTPEEAKKFKKQILSRDSALDWEGASIASTWDRYASLKSDGGQIEDLMRVYLTNVKTGLRPYDVYEAFLTWDRTPALEALKGPVLVIQGEKDIYVTHQERLLDILPDGERVVVPGAGPYMFYELPEECAAVIRRFLK